MDTPSATDRHLMGRHPIGRHLMGRLVDISLVDGSRIDGCQLVSVRRGPAASVWIFSNGEDRFLRTADIVEVWESAA